MTPRQLTPDGLNRRQLTTEILSTITVVAIFKKKTPLALKCPGT